MPSAINSAHTQFFEKTAFHPGAWQNKTPTGDSKIQTASNRTIAISQHEKTSPAKKRKIALLAGGLGLISGALVIGTFGGFGNASCGCSPCPPSSPSPCPPPPSCPTPGPNTCTAKDCNSFIVEAVQKAAPKDDAFTREIFQDYLSGWEHWAKKGDKDGLDKVLRICHEKKVSCSAQYIKDLKASYQAAIQSMFDGHKANISNGDKQALDDALKLCPELKVPCTDEEKTDLEASYHAANQKKFDECKAEIAKGYKRALDDALKMCDEGQVPCDPQVKTDLHAAFQDAVQHLFDQRKSPNLAWLGVNEITPIGFAPTSSIESLKPSNTFGVREIVFLTTTLGLIIFLALLSRNTKPAINIKGPTATTIDNYRNSGYTLFGYSGSSRCESVDWFLANCDEEQLKNIFTERGLTNPTTHKHVDSNGVITDV